MNINPVAIFFVAWGTCIGALAGSALWGATVALSFVMLVTWIESPPALPRRRRYRR